MQENWWIFSNREKLIKITLEKKSQKFWIFCWKNNKIFPQNITLKKTIASFIFLVLQSIKPINPKLFGVNTWFIFWKKKKKVHTKFIL
jgi:hypothetical protein